jgi:hypothetical protein
MGISILDADAQIIQDIKYEVASYGLRVASLKGRIMKSYEYLETLKL